MTRMQRTLVGFVAAAAVVGVLAYLPQQYGPTDTKLWAQAIYIGSAAMGLNILTGYNGQVSIGHGAFFGVGAYTTALLMHNQGWSFIATLPVCAVIAFVVGAAIGFPALRVKGLYLALVTLGLAVLFPDLTKRFVHATGGTNLVGLTQQELNAPPWVPSWASAQDQWAYYVCLVLAVILLIGMWLIVRSRFGRSLIAVRDHEAAAVTVGINLPLVKVSAFALSALYAAIAGSCSVLVLTLANAGKVETFQLSIQFLVAVVIGGTATLFGPAIGGFLVVYIQKWSTDAFPDKKLIAPSIFGIVLILFMYVLPDGLVGGSKRFTRFIRRRSSGRVRHSPAVPAPLKGTTT